MYINIYSNYFHIPSSAVSLLRHWYRSYPQFHSYSEETVSWEKSRLSPGQGSKITFC